MIGAVAHQVRQRVLDQFEHLAVELGLGAMHLQVDVPAEFGGKIAHDARQLLPRIADRLHARLHDAFLQLRGDVREALQRHLEVGILMAADDLEELVARQHKLGNRGHEMVERLDMDADRVVREPLAAFVVGPLGRGFVGRVLVGGRIVSGGLVMRRLRRLLQFGAGGRRWLCSLRQVGQRQAIEFADEIDVVSRRLAFVRFEPFKDGLDPVDGGENERDRLGRNRHAVAEFAHQAFGRVRQCLQAGQAKKAASALDGMDQAKNVAEDFAVIRLLFETHQLRVDTLETSRWSRSGTPGAGRPLKAPLTHTRTINGRR